VESISIIVLGAAILGVLIVLLLVLLQVRKLARSVTTVAKRMEKETAPVIERARSVAENVEFISMSVRTDVQKLNASVSGLNDRLKEASARMEDRIQDFNALVDLLQSEAEALALDTAAAVRGVRAGTRNLAADSPGSEDRASLGPYVFPTPDREEQEGDVREED
jgi:uncharacterized protein YoxC